MDRLEFRPLRDDELDEAYRIVCERTDWLLARGIRQWARPLPRAIFNEQQEAGQNFVLACDGRPAVVLALIRARSYRWRRWTGRDPCWWLCTLASAPRSAGRGLGEAAVEEAVAHLAGLGCERVYLDCIVHSEDFLPRYYARLGFEELARRTVAGPAGEVEMALMVRPCGRT